jgi:hypothetical protein
MGATPQLSWLGVIGYSEASAFPALLICWLGPKVREMANTGNPEGQKLGDDCQSLFIQRTFLLQYSHPISTPPPHSSGTIAKRRQTRVVPFLSRDGRSKYQHRGQLKKTEIKNPTSRNKTVRYQGERLIHLRSSLLENIKPKH